MPGPLADTLTPTMRKRMETMQIRSMRALARRMGKSPGGLQQYLTSQKPSLVTLLTLLKELGYPCKSPEFDLIYELAHVKGLQDVHDSDTLSESVRIEQYLYRQSTVQIRAA